MSWQWIAAVVLLWMVVLLLAVVVLGTLRRIAAVLERAEARVGGSLDALVGGAEPGTVLPPFTLVTSTGEEIDSTELAGSTALFLIVEPHCQPCQTLAAQLRSEPAVDGVPLYVVNRSHPGRDALAFPEDVTLLYDPDGAAAIQAFESTATPQAFVVDTGVVVERSIPNTLQDLRDLVAAAKGEGVRSEPTRPADLGSATRGGR